MLPLDADSLMAGDADRAPRRASCRRIRGSASCRASSSARRPTSAFARIFQFGMRHGMRAYTMGSAWWIGDCGPFWGHNALVRIAPFLEHCDLPILPGKPPLGGHVLSHDQVEATLMRRAGYEVRVLPEEGGSWEENPPTMLRVLAPRPALVPGQHAVSELLDLPGLLLMSRFQLAWAILMFLGVPALTLMIALVPLKFLDGEDLSTFPAGLAIGLYLTFLAMYLSPKLAGLADILLTRRAASRATAAGALPRERGDRDRVLLPARRRRPPSASRSS